jgi:hypothetical protein
VLKDDPGNAAVALLAGLAASVATCMHTVDSFGLSVANSPTEVSLAGEERKQVEVRTCLAFGETAHTPECEEDVAEIIVAATHSTGSACERHKSPFDGQAMQSSASAGNLIKFSDANSFCPPFPYRQHKQRLSIRSTSPISRGQGPSTSASGPRRQRIVTSTRSLADAIQPASVLSSGYSHIISSPDTLNAQGQIFRPGKESSPRLPQSSSSGSPLGAIRDKRRSKWSCSPTGRFSDWSTNDFTKKPAVSWPVGQSGHLPSVRSSSTASTQSVQSIISSRRSSPHWPERDECFRDVEGKRSMRRSASLTSPRRRSSLPSVSSCEDSRKVTRLVAADASHLAWRPC